MMELIKIIADIGSEKLYIPKTKPSQEKEVSII